MGAADGETAGGGPPRDLRLDGLRGIAILLVMLYHTTAEWLVEKPWERAVATFTATGWSGVDLFFVLSGFLITGILLRTRGRSGYFRAFYARRFLRIFPLYYLVLAFFLLLLPRITVQAEGAWLPGSDRETLWYWTYLSNLHAAWTGQYHHYFLGITWTLAIEEQFYLAWPLVVWLVPERRLGPLCLALIATALLARAAAVALDVNSVAIHTFTLFRMDALATGAWLAWALREPARRERVTRGARVVLPVALLAYAALVAALAGAHGATAAAGPRDPQLSAYTSHPVHEVAGYTILCALYGALLTRALDCRAGSRVERVLTVAPLVRLGRYAYGLYLVHLLAADLGRSVYEPRLQEGFLVPQLAYWAISIGLATALAALLWHAFEAPILRLRRFVPYPDGMPRPLPATRPDAARD